MPEVLRDETTVGGCIGRQPRKDSPLWSRARADPIRANLERNRKRLRHAGKLWAQVCLWANATRVGRKFSGAVADRVEGSHIGATHLGSRRLRAEAELDDPGRSDGDVFAQSDRACCAGR